MYYLSYLQNGLTALDVAAGVPSLLRSLGVTDRSHRAVRQLLREYMHKSSELDKEKESPNKSSQEPPQSADSQTTAVTRISQVHTRGGSRGGSLGSNEPPFLLTYWFLLLLPACFTLVPVVFGYCTIAVRLRASISRSVYSVKLVICSIFLRVELPSVK